MAKKRSVSSRPARPKSTNSVAIRNRRWTNEERRTLGKIAARQAVEDDSHIDVEDIPRLSEEQLAKMVRLRAARLAKVPVSLRLDPRVLAWLKSKGAGHLTRINDILMNVMEAERSAHGGTDRRR